MAASDVEHWQCDKTLPQCMAHMLDNQIMCDVTFLLGEERLEVHAHKYMLASRSPVFYAMLEGPMAERGKIEIPDIEKDIFEVFLGYVYTDDVSLTVENIFEVMYVSKKYGVDLLTKECKDFARRNITSENACVMMDSASMLQEEEIYKSCLEKIKYNTEVCICGPGFPSISRDTLKTITKLDDVNLSIKEEVLYEQVMKWCDAECERQQVEVTWRNKRKLLGDILYYIRFPAMDSKYFAEEIADHDLLTDRQKVDVMYYHALGISRTLNLFTCRERCSKEAERFASTFRKRCCGKIEKVIRFPTHAAKCWNLKGRTDAVGFKTSHDSKLYGLLLFACATSCTYTVEIVIKDSSEDTVYSTKIEEMDSCQETEIHDIFFEKPLTIEAQKPFRLELLMEGSPSIGGKDGDSRVPFADGKKEVFFFRSEPSSNGTNELGGQIPGLLLM